MTSHRAIWIFVTALVISLIVSIPAQAYIIDFDNLADLDPVTNQYSGFGVSFSNATVLTAGLSLNELEFPPLSGQNVVFDDGGPITIDFLALVTDAGGYFTYNTALTISAYDSFNNLIGTIDSGVSSNFISSGSLIPPNEYLHIAFAGGISQLVITGGAEGGSFTLDDFTATPVTPVPEPSMLLLLGSGLMGLAGLRRFRN